MCMLLKVMCFPIIILHYSKGENTELVKKPSLAMRSVCRKSIALLVMKVIFIKRLSSLLVMKITLLFVTAKRKGTVDRL